MEGAALRLLIHKSVLNDNDDHNTCTLASVSLGCDARVHCGLHVSCLLFVRCRTAVGAIIGKMGSIIKETQAETGARVQVANDTMPHSSEKMYAIPLSTACSRGPITKEPWAAAQRCSLRAQ
jgi:hypothetical protein